MSLDRNSVLTSAMFCGLGGFFVFMNWPDGTKGLLIGGFMAAIGVWLAVMPPKIRDRQVQEARRDHEAEKAFLSENPNWLMTQAPRLMWACFLLGGLIMLLSWQFLRGSDGLLTSYGFWFLLGGSGVFVTGAILNYVADTRRMLGIRRYRKHADGP